DWQPVTAVVHERVDPAGERNEEPASFVRERFPFLLGDQVQSHRAGDEVELEAFRPQHFGQPSQRAAAQIIKLKQPVLRRRITAAEKEIALVVGEDMRNAALIAADPHTTRDGGSGCSRTGWHAGSDFFAPPGVEFFAGNACRLADRGNWLAGAEPGEKLRG